MQEIKDKSETVKETPKETIKGTNREENYTRRSDRAYILKSKIIIQYYSNIINIKTNTISYTISYTYFLT